MSNFDETFLSMKPAILDSEDADAEANADPKESSSPKEPMSPVDEQGQDVFCGYSFRGERDADSVFGGDIVDEEMEDIEEANMDQDERHSSSRSASASTGPTSIEASLGHTSKDPSAISENHPRAQSSGLESLAEDAVLQPPIDLQTSLPELPAHTEEEEEWDVVEGEGPQEEYKGRGRLTARTFFARGIADKCKCFLCGKLEPGLKVRNRCPCRHKCNATNAKKCSRYSTVERLALHQL